MLVLKTAAKIDLILDLLTVFTNFFFKNRLIYFQLKAEVLKIE